MIISFNHSSFTVSDLDRSLDFYCSIIGMKRISYADRPQEYSETVTGIKGCPLKIAYLTGWGHRLELIEYVGSKKKSQTSSTDNIGAGHICFNVTDLVSMAEEYRNMGVELQSDPLVIPAGTNKGGMTFYMKDPDGIVIELIQLPN
jgi:catechol 2,3-dioxygenase-like lactoylglutathione lyase family enzyme